MQINGYQLDEYQTRVIESNNKNILVVAGAGAGKSLTIIGKIYYLINTCHLNEKEILCISLTNAASNNLKENLVKNGINNVNVYTFHKLSLEILKSHNNIYNIALDNLLEDVVDKYLLINNKYKDKALNYLVKNDSELENLKRLIVTFINLFKSSNYDINYFRKILHDIGNTFNYRKYKRNKYILLMVINIYIEYEKILKEEDFIDFNDMINKASKIIEEKGLKKNYKYVIIDEYQDTSLSKLNLIKNILAKTNANFLAVGDDFQSIYRFTGCDLNIFLNFTNYLENATILKLVNTYRNPQELIDTAGSFIMKNKFQIKKRLISNKHLNKPIKIYKNNNKIAGLKYILKIIDKEDIMVIGRNNKDIYSYIDKDFRKLENDYFKYQDITFKYLTAHKSKGLEANNTIIINLEDTTLGFPSQIKDDEILKYVKITKDYYPFEEERRLFYVALTRTKNNVYLLIPANKSVFIKEIIKYKENIEYLTNKE